ncbi:MAG TPA: YggT family protein [Candidatus Dormibacteraeota bacterium]|nr:YggT family protein [Candidatus Dormibacteraeota bacterium]
MIGRLVFAVLQVVILLVLARSLLSFFVRDWSSGPQRVVYDLTEPMLRPIRRVVPPMGGLDLSPMVLIIGIYLLDQFLAGIVGF